MPSHDASKIRYVGTDQLPKIAGHLHDAGESIIETSGDWEPAFRSAGVEITEIGFGASVSTPPLYAESFAGWTAAATAFNALLTEATGRLEGAAQVMITVADNYDRAEAHGVQRLQNVQNRLEQSATGE